MRIHKIHLRNFKRFEEKTVELHPQFTLLVGDNGAGKTTILDALAIAGAVWLVTPPDSTLNNSRRNILPKEIRLKALQQGDRVQFIEQKPVIITAQGEIAGEHVEWTREISENKSNTSNARAKAARDLIAQVYDQVQNGKQVPCPVLAYYGAGRAWLPSNERRQADKGEASGPARRWDAFYDCFEERIRISDLQNWFQAELFAYANRGGSWRPGYLAVKQAILQCLPEARDLWFDGDRREIVVQMRHQAHPFSNFSGGQRMMLALVADIAIKAVTQNAFMLPPEQLEDQDHPLPRVFKHSPGLVLIDELDVHLHPKWQRRVVDDLKNTFPEIQFICTSHSPFVIQSLDPGELVSLDDTGSALLEYSNRSVEDIAEEIQKVEVPQQSRHALELNKAAERYFTLLRRSNGEVESDELRDAESTYRQVAERYSSNPGLSALLKLEAMTEKKGGNT